MPSTKLAQRLHNGHSHVKYGIASENHKWDFKDVPIIQQEEEYSKGKVSNVELPAIDWFISEHAHLFLAGDASFSYISTRTRVS